MIDIIATNITSPLGFTSRQNYRAASSGDIALKVFPEWNGIQGPVCIGAFSDEQRSALSMDGFTFFEAIAIRSVLEAVSHADVDLSSEKTGFILGTTKGNIRELGHVAAEDGNYTAPGQTAKRIAGYLGIVSEPVVVCNACISGATAQVLAQRLISSGVYDTVIVCGADVVNEFCLAGFTSFKSMSPTPCRPFDIERLGLNIGECAATMVFSGKEGHQPGRWHLVSSCLNNDAYHISAPAPSGEGVARAIEATLRDFPREELAMICAHGTATMFNDQMESKAISGTGLSDLPLTACKGIYGHTFGAAGLIEAILSMESVDDGTVLPVCGFEEIGVSGKINISNVARSTDRESFIKLQSGFGGCNAVMLYSKAPFTRKEPKSPVAVEELCSIKLNPERLEIDGRTEMLAGDSDKTFVTEIYKARLSDNARFYKMDLFSRMVYVATGLLVKDRIADVLPESVSMLLFNRSSSIVADRHHISTYCRKEEFYPSPSVFINTLPNVVMGEIAAKYMIKGETTFIILPDRNCEQIDRIVSSSIAASDETMMVTGWVDCTDDGKYEADLKLLKIQR